MPLFRFWLFGVKARKTCAVRGLFDGQIDEKMLDRVREATNKAWILGSDRKSKAYKENAYRTSLIA